MGEKGYRDQDDAHSIRAQMDKLRADIRKIKAGEIMKGLKGGILCLLISGAILGVMYGISLVMFAAGQSNAMELGAIAELARVARADAVVQCEVACQHGGMELQHARLRPVETEDGLTLYNVSSCSCIQSRAGGARFVRTVLWNDSQPFPSEYCPENFHCEIRINDQDEERCVMRGGPPSP